MRPRQVFETLQVLVCGRASAGEGVRSCTFRSNRRPCTLALTRTIRLTLALTHGEWRCERLSGGMAEKDRRSIGFFARLTLFVRGMIGRYPGHFISFMDGRHCRLSPVKVHACYGTPKDESGDIHGNASLSSRRPAVRSPVAHNLFSHGNLAF